MRSAGSATLTPASQDAIGSVESTFRRGSSFQSRAPSAPSSGGTPNSTDSADVVAVYPGPLSVATTSRSTPRSCTRASSTDANRSAGAGAHALASQR